MKLKCPLGCKVKTEAKFWRTWSITVLHDANGRELDVKDPRWEKKFRCVRCNTVAVKQK